MTSKEKQEYAFLLFSRNEGLTLEQIAQKCEVHPNTITRWRKKNKWDETRETLLTTRQEQLRRLYMQLKELNDHIMEKPEGSRFANKSEADAMTQITRSISNLEKENSIGTVIDVFMPFLRFAAKVDGDLAKDIVELQDLYIKSLLK